METVPPFKGRRGVEFVEPLQVVSKGGDWMQAWAQMSHWQVY